jgi:hypothetical protein
MAAKTKIEKNINWQFPLQKQNFIILGIGLAVILIGYLLMSTGVTEQPAILDGKWNNPMAIVVAPLLLVIGYCVIIPFGLFRVFQKSEQ